MPEVPAPDSAAATNHRRLVLCLDGTWNNTYAKKLRADGEAVLKPSNVLKLGRGVVPQAADGRDQIVYYDTGVGAMGRFDGASNNLLHRADKLLGGAWGAGFEGNVEDALHFLVLNYQAGDHVFVFGFSRGASTARGVTRFIDWCGGLPTKRDIYYLPILFREFVDRQGQGSSGAKIQEINTPRPGRKKKPLEPFHQIDVRPLGVWDTVMALGGRFKATGASTSTVSRSFYVGAEPARCVANARQALAIDEARYDFRPEIWTAPSPEQSLEQRWFAGVHSNVGGGYVQDGLANIAFQWFVREAEALGLEVDRGLTGKFRAFPQDRLYESMKLKYRVFDRIRFRVGKGKRKLADQPASANLSLDRSVIHRLRVDPEALNKKGEVQFPRLEGRTYRPENVLQFLANQDDLPAYLESLGLEEEHRQLPEDVQESIAKLRGG